MQSWRLLLVALVAAAGLVGAACRTSSPPAVAGADAAGVEAGVPARCVRPAYPSPDYIGDVELNRYPGTHEGYPECPAGVFSGRWRIDGVRFEPHSNPAYPHFFTRLAVVGLDVPEPCGVVFKIMLKNEVLALQAGSIIRTSYSYVPLPGPEDDATGARVIRDDAGAILFAWVYTVPKQFDSEMVVGLRLQKLEIPTCPEPTIYAAIMHLTSTGGDCVIESFTKRCCTLWNLPYEVRFDYAQTYPSGIQDTRLRFTIRAKGLARSMGLEGDPPPPICP